MRKYQKYSEELKKEAVRLLASTRKPKTTIKNELGITLSLQPRVTMPL